MSCSPEIIESLLLLIELDSVISSTVDSTSMCTKSESVASHLHSNSSATAVGVASHPMSKRKELMFKTF